MEGAGKRGQKRAVNEFREEPPNKSTKVEIHEGFTTLGLDPVRKHRLNACSFQQDTITSFKGYQYAVFYSPEDPEQHDSPALVHIARRHLKDETHDSGNSTLNLDNWDIIAFPKHKQTTDDGHNTISMGISKGDGRIHLSFDHHCDVLKYCCTGPGVATHPEKTKWELATVLPDHPTGYVDFSPVAHTIPGIGGPIFEEVTYPRFVSIGDDMLFSFRIGQAGSGSDVLFRYSSSTGVYELVGQHLAGAGNSPYVNGIDYRNDRLHISWTYRAFIQYEGVNDPNSTAHKAQAGPNGPENNYDLHYIYSQDLGWTWHNSAGDRILRLRTERQSSVTPKTEGITVFEIPKNSGIMNQESQCADYTGGFHVLNRENTSGEEQWYIYSRSKNDKWSHEIIPGVKPTETSHRGSICCDRQNRLHAVLPDVENRAMMIYSSGDSIAKLKYVSTIPDVDGEPLVDTARLEESGVLSIFNRSAATVDSPARIKVWDIRV